LVPTLVDEPPAAPGWIHEIKHDGYRTILAIEGDATRAFTRNGHDWTRQYRTVVATAAQLPCRPVVKHTGKQQAQWLRPGLLRGCGSCAARRSCGMRQ
jgi:hypothetical protein